MLSYLVAFASDPALVNERQRYSAFTQGIRKLGIHPILVDTAVAVQVPGDAYGPSNGRGRFEPLRFSNTKPIA